MNRAKGPTAMATSVPPDRPQLESAGWTAQWVGLRELSHIDGSIAGLDATPAQRPPEVVMFRRDTTLQTLPARAWLRMSADSRYIAWINGVEVSRGPARSQPWRLMSDLVDITHALRVGANAIAVSVTYFGDANAFWMPASVAGGLGTGAALVAELHVQPSPEEESQVIATTGGDWWLKKSAAFARLPRTDVEGVPAEVFDARLEDDEWATRPVRYSDGWTVASPLAAGHLASAGRAVPPVDPYAALPVNRASAMTQRWIDAVARRVIPVAASTNQIAADGDHPSAIVSSFLAVGDPNHRPPATRHIVEYDFGRIVAGIVELKFAAERGDVFNVDLRETRVGDGPYVPHGLRYIARGDDDGFSSADSHGLRFLAILLPDGVSPDVVQTAAVRERTYPRIGGAVFRSGDSELDAIWLAGLRSVEVNSTDAYTDCPTREQRSWVGDAVVHLETDMYTNQDCGLARHYLEMAASPQPSGILPMAVAGDIEAASSTTIPAYSLLWAWGVYVYAQHRGIDETIRKCLPVMLRCLQWFRPYINERGTLSDVPGWGFVDWSAIYLDGDSSITTSLWTRALRAFSELSRSAGNFGDADWADQMYSSARAGFENFWDSERGLYLDRAPDQTPRSRAASQLASAAAIVSGMAPSERWHALAGRIADRRMLVTRSWLGHAADGFDLGAIQRWTRHAPEPDWDVDRQIVRAEPFGSAIVHDAFALAGRTAELLDSVRSWSTFLVDGYDTFGEGWGWGSRAHAWSATPTRDLLAHIVGARPYGFGGDIWSLDPAPVIDKLEARISTTKGMLEIHLTPDAIEVESPVSLRVGDRPMTALLPPGRHRISRSRITNGCTRLPCRG